MAKKKELGLAARVARDSGLDIGGGTRERSRKFDRSEWDLQDDGSLVNVKTGEVRESLEGLEAEAAATVSSDLDQSLSSAGKAEAKTSQVDEWDSCQDFPEASSDSGGRTFDEYSQVSERRKPEDAGDKVKFKKSLPAWVRVSKKGYEKQPLPGMHEGDGKATSAIKANKKESKKAA